METEAKHIPNTTRTDAVIDTGAALASAAGFGLFGAVVGRTIGAFGNSPRHNISGTIGAWLGGVTLAVLSLYASFRGREAYERTIDQLQQENAQLRKIAGVSTLPPEAQRMMGVPQHQVSGVSHEGQTASEPEQHHAL